MKEAGSDLNDAVAQVEHDRVARAEPGAQEWKTRHLATGAAHLLGRYRVAGAQQMLVHVAPEVLEQGHLLVQVLAEHGQRIEVLAGLLVDVLHVAAHTFTFHSLPRTTYQGAISEV